MSIEDGPVLAVFAHPDDAEIAAGATLAKWCASGRSTHLLVLTNGDRGSKVPGADRAEIARIRASETHAAARVLGLSGARILDIHDGELANGSEVRGEVVRTIRELRPSTVLTCDPTAWFFEDRYVNHADHRTAGAIALDAVFPASGNPLFHPEHLDDGLEVHTVTDVWLAWTGHQNHLEDVTGFLEVQLAALAEHRSQVEGDMLGHFQDLIPEQAEAAGRMLGVRHAEAFRRLDLS